MTNKKALSTRTALFCLSCGVSVWAWRLEGASDYLTKRKNELKIFLVQLRIRSDVIIMKGNKLQKIPMEGSYTMKACKRFTVWMLVLALLLQLVPAFTIALAADTQELIETTYGSFNGEGLWLTEIYTNDVNRSTTDNTREDKGYESIDLFDSGSSDLMEFVEICSTHDADIKLNDMYEIYNGSNKLVITDASGSSDITLTKGQPVVLWNYRTDLGITLPTEAQFRKALFVPDNALVLRVNYGGGWSNTAATFKIILKSTGATVSSFTFADGTHTSDGMAVELKVPLFKSSAMEVYREMNLPSPGYVYTQQVRGMITANTPSVFDGKGVYITEIRPNDVNRSATYGTSNDVMECLEVVNTTDAEINLNKDYRIVYTTKEGNRKVLQLHKYSSTASDHKGSSANCVIPAGGTVVLWCYKYSTLTDYTSFPTLTKFRNAYGISSDIPVYIFDNQNTMNNTNRAFEVFKTDSNGGLGQLICRYCYLGDSDCADGKSVQLRINPEGPNMIVNAANAASDPGTVDPAQLKYKLDDGSAMEVRPYDGCEVPTSIMQGEDLRVWF